MAVVNSGARVAAAAFVLGLSLAGPQAVGVAAADGSDAQSAGTQAAGPQRATRNPGTPRRSAATARETAPTSADPQPVIARQRAASTVRKSSVSRPPTASTLRRNAAVSAPALLSPQLPVAQAAVVNPNGSQGPAAIVARTVTTTVGTASLSDATPEPPIFVRAVSAYRDFVNGIESMFFNRLSNALIDLPGNAITDFLQGALLLVRKSLFNQAPEITPTTPHISQTGSGVITGRIGGIDVDGETLTYSVVTNPELGTVAVAADGSYTYTPGPDYAGADAFTVNVAPADWTFNLFTPFDNGSREVTIQVGASAPTTPFQALQPNETAADVSVYLPTASSHIAVQNSRVIPGRYTATVTLTGVIPGTQLMWMDSVGNNGQFSLQQAVQSWPDFAAKATLNGGGVALGVAFAAADGTENAMLLSQVSMTQNAQEQFVFSGVLSGDPAVHADSVDTWDMLGREYQQMYQSFRMSNNIGSRNAFVPFEFDVNQAAMFVSTYSTVSYQQDGLYAFDYPTTTPTPDAATPVGVSAQVTAGATVSAEIAQSPVTVSLPLGQSFVIGRADGSVELWTDGVKQLLRNPTGLEEINKIVEYNRPLQDAQGAPIASSFVGSIAGTTLTVTALGSGGSVDVGQEITGLGVAAGTTIVKFIEPAPSCAEKDGAGNCTKAVVGAGGFNGGPGTYEVSISQTVGSLGTQVTFTEPAIQAIAPGFIVGLDDGSIQQWSATDGWIELHDNKWPTSASSVTAMITYGDGIVVGLGNGSVQKWDGPGASTDPSTWKDNWTELQAPSDRFQAVKALVAHQGATAEDTGLVVAMDQTYSGIAPYTTLEFWNADSGWTELENRVPGTAVVSSMTGYRASLYNVDGVAIGYSDGTVQYWDGTIAPAGVTVLAGSGWGQPVDTMVPITVNGWSMLAVGLAGQGGGVQLYTGREETIYFSGGWRELQGTGWNQSVRSMTTYNSAALGSGLVVGLGGFGAVELWSEKNFSWDDPQSNMIWTELHDNGWQSPVVTLIPFSQNLADAQGNLAAQDGVVVGLGNGSVQQWSGLVSGQTGQADWTQIVCGPSGCVSPTPTLDDPGKVEEAFDYAIEAAGQKSPTWGAQGNVGGPLDPLFYQTNLLPPCAANGGDCEGEGTYVPIASYIPLSSDPYHLAAGTASVDLRYDVNPVLYGYALVPDGVWNKLSPGKWSVAMFTAVQTGPALTVTLGEGGTISSGEVNLFDYEFSTPGPLGFDRVGLGVGADGELSAQLQCAGGSTCSDKLNAHAYFVPGMLFTYNTQSTPNGVSLGFNYYTDIDYEQFAAISGVAVTATLTPYADVSYGIWIPESYPFVGGWSLFKLGVGYENPVEATLTANQGGVTLGVTSQGYVTTHAGILESLTSLLSWDNSIQVYEYPETTTL